MPAPLIGSVLTPDKTPPTAPGTPVITNALSNETVTVTVTASTDAVGVAGYAVFLDGNVAEAGRSASVVINLTKVPAGSHSVVVKAFDKAGNYSLPSAASGFNIPVLNKGKLISNPSIPTLSALTAAITEGLYSQTITVLGDSTGYNTWMWVYKLGQLFAATYPTLRVEYELFDTTNATPAFWDYAAPEVLNAGNTGARSIRFTGVRGRNITAALVGAITGDADVSAQVAMDSWSSARQSIVSRYDIAAGGFNFYQESGTLGVELLASGYANKTATVFTGFTNGQVAWVRFTYVAASGLITFYTSTDGVAWVQLGATVSATVVGAFVQIALKDYEIGSKNGPSTGGPGIDNALTGNIYNVRIRQGINGPVMNPQPIESWYEYFGGGSSLAGSQTLYIKNGSVPGATLSFLNTTLTINKQVQDSQPNIVFLSCSHNDLSAIDKNYFTSWSTYIAAIKARSSECAICILTQNPNAAGAAFIESHGKRAKRLITYAQSNNLAYIDTFTEFVRSPLGIEALTGLPENIDGLGVHPNATGSKLWADTIFNCFQ
jgi:lysophospholipase L1-like esterase